VRRDSMPGHSRQTPNMIPGNTMPGRKTSKGMVWPHPLHSHEGMIRNAPSIHARYQSGWDADETLEGLYGPNCHIGLIWAKAARSAMPPVIINRKPPVFAVKFGQNGVPTTLRRVRCRVSNWVCLLTKRMMICAPTRASSKRGMRRMCTAYIRANRDGPPGKVPWKVNVD